MAAAAAADATAAMTVDFLRARLLSERSVSRAAKERADHLARRVAELEEQLRAVTAQRRKAERATAEVLAILDSQGFGRLSDGSEDEAADDTGDPGGNAAAEAEDALSGSELGASAAAAATADGGLSWKGRAAGLDCERRRPPPPQAQQKGRQVRQRHGHGHGHRRGYLFSRAADSLPKYHPGQSCRKIKRKELRSQPEGEDGKGSAEEGQARSDCTVCTDERPDFDGEGSQDGRGSSSNGRVEDGGDEYAMDYRKGGEMERVLEKQAELIGQYEAQENAQREWEKKFSENRDSTVDIELNQTQIGCRKRESAQITDKEVVCEQVRSSENCLFGISNPSEYQPKDSAAELSQNAAKGSAIAQCKVGYYDREFGENSATVVSVDGELQVRKDTFAAKSYPEVDEGSGSSLGKPAPSPKGCCDSSQNAGHDKGQGDEISDSGSSYHVNACSSQRYLNTSSVESPLSDTPKSAVSEWSSSCFHNHTDNQLDTQLHQPSSDDVGGVLDALQRAKMSLGAKLSRPIAPSQSILALPAPDDLPVNDMQLPLSRSTFLSQEILALAAPADYLNRMFPRGHVNVPLGHDGLFRLPTDLFPRSEMASSDGYGSRFSLTVANGDYEASSYIANHVRPTPSFAQCDSGFSPDPYHNPHGLSVPTAGGYPTPMSNFRIGDGEDFRRVRSSGDARTHFQHGHD